MRDGARTGAIKLSCSAMQGARGDGKRGGGEGNRCPHHNRQLLDEIRPLFDVEALSAQLAERVGNLTLIASHPGTRRNNSDKQNDGRQMATDRRGKTQRPTGRP